MSMFYSKYYLLVLLLVCLDSATIAQTAKFSWVGEICSSEGTYKSSLYTKAQISDTYRLAMTDDFDLQTGRILPQTIEELGRESVAELDREYEKKSIELAALDLVENPYWQVLKTRKIAAMNEMYHLRRATMLAYTDPSALNTISGKYPASIKYAKALNSGGEELLNVWNEINNENRLKNASPGRLKELFDRQSSAPDWYKYATMEVMAFGWWNRAIRSLSNVDTSESQDNFIKLFRSVKNFDCNSHFSH